MEKLKIYGDGRSGNCYKLQLLCSEMGIRYDWEEVDILAGDTRTAEFLSKNPNGRIPLLELPDGRHLAESNAILCYLADGSEFFGSDAWSRAKISAVDVFRTIQSRALHRDIAIHHSIPG